ncbi:helix-turn-helix transcriptional regulator [Paludifilum halophilum]
MVINRIRKLREIHGLTQLELAKKLNITRQTVIAIESYKYNPSLKLALEIADFFNMRVEEIFEIREGDSTNE